MSCSTIIVGSSWSFGVPRLLINVVKGMQGPIDFNPLQLLCHLGSQKQFGVLSLKRQMPVNLCLQHLQFIYILLCQPFSRLCLPSLPPFFDQQQQQPPNGKQHLNQCRVKLQIPDACNPKLLAKFSTFHSTPNLVVVLVNLK